MPPRSQSQIFINHERQNFGYKGSAKVWYKHDAMISEKLCRSRMTVEWFRFKWFVSNVQRIYFFKLRELNLLYNDAKKIYRLIGGDGSSNILVIPWPWCPKSFLFGASGEDNFIWEAWISKYGKWDFAKFSFKIRKKLEEEEQGDFFFKLYCFYLLHYRLFPLFWQNFFNTFGFMSCVCADFSEYIL